MPSAVGKPEVDRRPSRKGAHAMLAREDGNYSPADAGEVDDEGWFAFQRASRALEEGREPQLLVLGLMGRHQQDLGTR